MACAHPLRAVGHWLHLKPPHDCHGPWGNHSVMTQKPSCQSSMFGLWRKACLQAPQLGSGREELRARDSHKAEVLATTWTLDLSS